MNALVITNGTATRMAVIAARTGSELMAGAKAMMIENLKEKMKYSFTLDLFVIILDRSKYFNDFKRVFEYLGIPTEILQDDKLNTSVDIAIIKNKDKNFSNSYDCTLIKTYNVDNINSSNDSNYLYITFKEYQVEGVYTIKLSKTISKDLEIGKNYEFTFNTYKEYISSSPTEIFEKSELINIESSDKVGIEQKNEFNCK